MTGVLLATAYLGGRWCGRHRRYVDRRRRESGFSMRVAPQFAGGSAGRHHRRGRRDTFEVDDAVAYNMAAVRHGASGSSDGDLVLRRPGGGCAVCGRACGRLA